MRMIWTLLLIFFLMTACLLESSRLKLENTTWKFSSLRCDSNYGWDTLEIFTNQKINRLIFTRDSFFSIRNDSRTFPSKYLVRFDRLITNNGVISDTLIIRKLTMDSLCLYNANGVTYYFLR